MCGRRRAPSSIPLPSGHWTGYTDGVTGGKGQSVSDDLAVEAERRGSLPTHVILPAGGWVPLGFRELWEYRELLYFLTWRNIKVRYKQTVLGAAWAVLQPLLTMVIFSIFFGRLAHIPSEGIPYPIFAFSALVPWMYFANTLSQASNSLVEHERMITKVYFPRVLIPAAAVLAGLPDLSISLAVLLALLAYYGIALTAAIVALPLFGALCAATSLAAGLWFASLYVRYRDVRYIIPFLIQVWLFATPIAYPVSLVPTRWQAIYGLNPMVAVVEGFRWCLVGKDRPSGTLLAASLATVVVLLISGLYYFRYMEQGFADVV